MESPADREDADNGGLVGSVEVDGAPALDPSPAAGLPRADWKAKPILDEEMFEC
jgi:hypothetical protein